MIVTALVNDRVMPFVALALPSGDWGAACGTPAHFSRSTSAPPAPTASASPSIARAVAAK